jgi:hypothetical protein
MAAVPTVLRGTGCRNRVGRLGSGSQHPSPPDPRRRIWLLDSAENVASDNDVKWLLEGIRQAIETIASHPSEAFAPRRARRLIGIPLVGVCDGGYGAEVGIVIKQILTELSDAIPADVDVALVLRARISLVSSKFAGNSTHQSCLATRPLVWSRVWTTA